jgi:phage virion morphogenesis protein
MPGTSITITQDALLISLGDLQRRVDDRDQALRIVGNLMYASVRRTFRDEGSPAGSWPALAASTLQKKGYSAGHKLLILSARLRNSITYWVEGDTVTVGTNVKYAAVHQYGSADRLGGSIGPQARIDGRGVQVGAHSFERLREIRYKRREVVGKDGRKYLVPAPVRGEERTIKYKNGNERTVTDRYQGPKQLLRGEVGAHERFQNIPARPFLVVRPEDPARFVRGINAYLRGGKLRWEGA